MKFQLGTTKEVPLPTRMTQSYGFPWGQMGLKKNNHFDIPMGFWETEVGLKGDDLKPNSLKERIRRNFYGWRDEGEAKAKAAITQEEIDKALAKDANGNYKDPEKAKEFLVRGNPIKPREAIKGKPAKHPERKNLTITQSEQRDDMGNLTGIRVFLVAANGTEAEAA